jgi:thioesterase domain-containing protein
LSTTGLLKFFCVAGLGGNLMNLCHLAKALGKRQPFYGLQHRGFDYPREQFLKTQRDRREVRARRKRA